MITVTLYSQVYHSLPLHLYSESLMLLLVSSVIFVHETMSPMHWSGYIGYQLPHVSSSSFVCWCTMRCLAPSYITAMLQPVTTLDRQVTLRSADNNDLFITRSRLRLGERAFCIAAPRAWNSLPSDVKSADTVRTFKKRLKTFLFSKHYFNIQ